MRFHKSLLIAKDKNKRIEETNQETSPSIVFEDLEFNDDYIEDITQSRIKIEFPDKFKLVEELEKIDPKDNNINIYYFTDNDYLGYIDVYVWPYQDLSDNKLLVAQLNIDDKQKIFSQSPIYSDNRQDWWQDFIDRVKYKLQIIEDNIDFDFEDD